MSDCIGTGCKREALQQALAETQAEIKRLRAALDAVRAEERERWTEAVMAELDGNGQAQAIVAYAIRATPSGETPP